MSATAGRGSSIAVSITPSGVALLLAIAAAIDAGDPAYELLVDASPDEAGGRSVDLKWLSDHAFIRAEFVAGGRGPTAAVVVSGLTDSGAHAIGRELDRNGVLTAQAS